jgi:hypothetical protein
MSTHWIVRVTAFAAVMMQGWGCALLGPTCVARQERHNVALLQGEVAAGEIVVHQVAYDTRGSQNDAVFLWNDQFTGGPRLRAYATRIECTDFQPPPVLNTGACTTLASAGWTPSGIAGQLILTHGRGNPERLGTPPAYKIWIVGDAEKSARYTLEIKSFFGPDC